MNKRFIGIILIVLIVIGIVAFAFNKLAVQNDSNRNKSLASLKNDVPVPEVNDPGSTVPVPFCDPQKVNMENFEKIKEGMTADEIFEIFDGFGEPLTTVEDYEQGKEIYQLEAENGKGRILITFQNEKVSGKEGFDLN